ncbi:MAG: histidine kinase [Saprospiraceae bacterium]|nr:histidine kinase [Saprospiraceae bacterium]
MRLFFLYITILLHFPLFSQSLSFRQLTVQDGLAQSEVSIVLGDSRGFIWAGTQGGGLSRYDGANFVNFSTRLGLPDNRVNALWEDEDGRLWIGTDNGLAFYEGNEIVRWGKRRLNVKAIHQDTSGQLWMGTVSGLYRKTEQSVTRLPKPSRQVNAIFTDKSGHTWLGSKEGLWELVNDIPRQVEGFSIEILALGEDAEGLLYLATAEQGIFIWNGSNFSPFIGNRWLPKGRIESLYGDSSGNLWIGSTAGLFLWDAIGASMQQMSLRPGQRALSIDKDIWGNLWVGTNQGLSLYGGRVFDFYSMGVSNGSRRLSFLGISPKGMIEYGIENEGIYGLRDSITTNRNVLDWNLGFTAQDIEWDSDSSAWIAADRKGLLRWTQDSMVHMEGASGIETGGYRDLVLDTTGIVWAIPTEGGLWEIRARSDTAPQFEAIRWGRLEGLPSIRLNHLHLDREQRLWISTKDAGLLCWKKGALLYQFDRSTGMPVGELYAIEEDSSGYLWVGSPTAGLARLDIYADSIGVTHFTYRDGLYSNTVNSLICTRDQELWIGSESGVDRVLLDADRMPKSVQHYGPAEGFEGVETLPNLAVEDLDGNLYWGTVAGLVKYNAKRINNTRIPPGIIITGVQLFTEDLSATPYGTSMRPWNRWENTLEFPHPQNNFTFSFLGIEQNQATKIRYQYQLVGWDPDWSVETENKEITYANLTPGQYRFQVRSVQTDTGITSNPIRLDFVVKAPWWEWQSVRWGGVMLLILGVGGIFRRELRKVQQRAQAAAERLRLDKQILELEQKALQLQMNPHFIFNALNSIQLLIGRQDPKTARRYLAKFSKLMRSTLENARQPKVLLAEEIDSLEAYLNIEQFSRGHTFDYELTVHPVGEAEEVAIPSMMVQPFVENAIIHGVAPLKGAGKISVRFEIQAREVVCIVKDNGIGYAKEGTAGKGKHKSLALQVTRERLALLDESGRPIEEVFEIGSNPAAEGGTYVKIHLPLL